MTVSVYLVGIGSFVGLILILTGLILVANRYLADYGTCRIKINEEEPFDVEGGGTLLSALYGQKIFIPSGCGGQATCGLCKCRVFEGGGQVLPTEMQFLSRAEIKQNVRISCQVKVKRDLHIGIPEEFLKVQEFKSEVLYNKKVTYDMTEIRFKLIEPDTIDFRPGQFVQVRIPDPDSSEGFAFRAYSISSRPSEHNEVELVVRLVPGGKGSTWIHGLKAGDPVVFTGPYGEFVFNPDPEAHMLLVGGGAGMAPLKGLVDHIMETTPTRPMHLFFGCRSIEDVFYLDRFKEMSEKNPSFQVTYALSDVPPEKEKDWNGPKGFIHLQVDSLYSPPERHQVFLCGPPPMIDATIAVLQKKGLREDEIFYDKF